MHMYISIDTLELIKNWGAQVGDPWVFALMDPRTAIPGCRGNSTLLPSHYGSGLSY